MLSGAVPPLSALFFLVVGDVTVLVFELSYKAPEAERVGLFFSNPQIQGHLFALTGKCLHALQQE
jgi:hypothetical protein